MLWYAVQNFRLGIFFFHSFLSGLVDLMGSSRSWAEFTRGRNKSYRPVPGRKDPTDSRNRDSGAALILCLISMWCLHDVYRTVAPVEQISELGGLRPLIHDLHLLWPYLLEHLLKRYSSHSHALTGDEQNPMAVYHPGATAAERLEAGRW